MNLDYAALYEARRRRSGPRYAGVLVVWLGLLVIRPGLALDIWNSRAFLGG